MNHEGVRQPLPVDARRTYDGALFQVYQWSETGYDGESYLFEKVTRPDAVVVLPVMEDQVVLAWESQPGGSSVLGFFGGRVEPGELIEEAARRELVEEAGWAADVWEYWESVRPSAKVDWSIHFFSVRNIHQAGAAPQADERIELRPHALDGFIRAVTASDFGDPVAALPVLRVLAQPGGRAALASRLFGT